MEPNTVFHYSWDLRLYWDLGVISYNVQQKFESNIVLVEKEAIHKEWDWTARLLLAF